MAWTQAVQWLQTVLKAPNSSLSHGQSQKCQFYVGLSLMKQLKIIKSWPSNIQLLFCVMKWEVHTIGFSSLLLHSLCCNVTLVKYMKKLWLCTNGKGKRISNSFFTSVYGRTMTVSRKSTCATVAVVSWTTCFFHGSPGWLESTTDRCTMVSQPCGSGRHFLAYEHSEPVTSRKTPGGICCQL